MLSVAHALTGAFIASKTGQPALFVPLTFASHYLEDWIPHWDVGTGLSNGSRSRSTALALEMVDLAATAGLLWWYWQSHPSVDPLLLGAGAFVGLLPDFFEAPRNFLKWEPFFLTPFNKIHGLFHHSTPNKVLGLIPQVIVIATILLLK